jgi:hypothetical protein
VTKELAGAGVPFGFLGVRRTCSAVVGKRLYVAALQIGRRRTSRDHSREGVKFGERLNTGGGVALQALPAALLDDD